jgi:hypothetical protein
VVRLAVRAVMLALVVRLARWRARPATALRLLELLVLLVVLMPFVVLRLLVLLMLFVRLGGAGRAVLGG